MPVDLAGHRGDVDATQARRGGRGWVTTLRNATDERWQDVVTIHSREATDHAAPGEDVLLRAFVMCVVLGREPIG
jgi:hypothetical protein